MEKAPQPASYGADHVLRRHHQTVEQVLVDHGGSFQFCGVCRILAISSVVG